MSDSKQHRNKVESIKTELKLAKIEEFCLSLRYTIVFDSTYTYIIHHYAPNIGLQVLVLKKTIFVDSI